MTCFIFGGGIQVVNGTSSDAESNESVHCIACSTIRLRNSLFFARVYRKRFKNSETNWRGSRQSVEIAGLKKES